MKPRCCPLDSAATNYAESIILYTGDRADLRLAFIAGANWSQGNPIGETCQAKKPKRESKPKETS